MTKIEALEIELAARKLVADSHIAWQSVIRHKSSKKGIDLGLALAVNFHVSTVELALGVVENKPVFEGDILYRLGEIGAQAQEYTITKDHKYLLALPCWTWEPPEIVAAPIVGNVVIELPKEVAEKMAAVRLLVHDRELADLLESVINACQKAINKEN